MATAVSDLQVDALSHEEGRRWELLEGELIQVSSPTPRHQVIVFNILIVLRQYLADGKGISFADVEFGLSDLLRLRPDVCVLLKEKATQVNPDRIPVPGAPDIAIEVISPAERAVESHDKIRAYLRNGAIEVWQDFLAPAPSRFIPCPAARSSIRRRTLSATFSRVSTFPWRLA
jgi:Uma2 family endonuclease